VQTNLVPEVVAEADGDELSLGGLEDLLGFHLRRAQAAMYRHFVAALAKLELTQRQFAVLELLNANPGASQVDLAGILTLDRPAVMTVIDRLEERRLVIRQRSRSDRRRQEIRLTETGSELLLNARKLVRRHDARFTSRFSKAETQVLIGALKRVYRDVRVET